MRVYNEQLVRAPYPFGFIGDGLTRCVVLAVPAWKVRSLLPANLEICEQNVTPKGTHPLVLLFHVFAHCQFSFPTFLPPMEFNEQTLGVPFTGIPGGARGPEQPGPFYFMPKLYLDHVFVWMIGRAYWGFDKEMAIVNVNQSSYSVTSAAGRPLASLVWRDGGSEPRVPVDSCPEFEPIRQMLTQPLISLLPAALGPFFKLTDFDRNWNLATIRQIDTVLDIDPFYLPGFEGGHFATSGELAETLPRPLVSYELSAPWWLSYPYLPSPSMP
jgi:hypothetical protein